MIKNSSETSAYRIGDSDERPWGRYEVTGVGTTGAGEEYCEKAITVKPGQALSLQSHDLRRETWRVDAGVLTVVLDDRRLTLKAGEEVFIPQGGIHCMANLGSAPCIVHECQEGICREEDIRRFRDAYGRGTEKPETPAAQAALALYNGILRELGFTDEKH